MDYITNDNVDFILQDNDTYISADFEMAKTSRDQSENSFGLALI